MKLTHSSALVGVKWAVAVLVSFWLGIPVMVQLLVTCMGLDFATGLLAAFIHRELASLRGFVGIAKKVLILILVASAHLVGEALHMPFDLGVAVAAAYVVNEVISIVENCANAGVPIPPVFVAALLKANRMTGRGEQATVTEKLESVTVSHPDGIGGVESISSITKVTTGPKNSV